MGKVLAFAMLRKVRRRVNHHVSRLQNEDSLTFLADKFEGS